MCCDEDQRRCCFSFCPSCESDEELHERMKKHLKSNTLQSKAAISVSCMMLWLIKSWNVWTLKHPQVKTRIIVFPWSLIATSSVAAMTPGRAARCVSDKEMVPYDRWATVRLSLWSHFWSCGHGLSVPLHPGYSDSGSLSETGVSYLMFHQRDSQPDSLVLPTPHICYAMLSQRT